MVSDVGGIDDASFNQNTWEGLQRAQEELGIEAQFIESQAQADYERNITEFAEQDYDLVFTVGFLLNDATAKMAPEYPDVYFAIIDQWYDPAIPNAVAITFNVDEAAFPIGYLAAGWAVLQDPDDPQIGYVAGMQIPPVEQFIVAYEAGAAYYNEQKGTDVQVKGVYVGDFEAPDQGKIQGKSLIDEGVDIIFGVGGKTGNGGIAAAKERRQVGRWRGRGPVLHPAQREGHPDHVVHEAAGQRGVWGPWSWPLNGEFPAARIYVGTLENGGVGLAPYHDFEGEIPAELDARSAGHHRRASSPASISTGW
jgi:basic membrane protein A and related proteins